MGNDLASFLAGLCKTKAEDDVIEARLQDLHQVSTGDAGHGLSAIEVAVELLLENAIDKLCLLLLAQLHAVFAFLTAALRLTDGA